MFELKLRCRVEVTGSVVWLWACLLISVLAIYAWRSEVVEITGRGCESVGIRSSQDRVVRFEDNVLPRL